MDPVERNNGQPSRPGPDRDAAAMAISPKFCIFGAGAKANGCDSRKTTCDFLI
jgi:hypothetical protein